MSFLSGVERTIAFDIPVGVSTETSEPIPSPVIAHLGQTLASGALWTASKTLAPAPQRVSLHPAPQLVTFAVTWSGVLSTPTRRLSLRFESPSCLTTPRGVPGPSHFFIPAESATTSGSIDEPPAASRSDGRHSISVTVSGSGTVRALLSVQEDAPTALPAPAPFVAPPPPMDTKRIATTNAYLTASHPNDTRFLFPNGLELWASAIILRDVTYFRALLDSEFTEGSLMSIDVGRGELPSRSSEVDNDSDDESDEYFVSRKSPASQLPHCESKVHTIKVTSACYTTYHAVLVYLYTGEIKFRTPLRSTRRAQPPTAESEPAFKDDSLLVESSPKSVYRLAHFLDMPDLKSTALASFKTQLTAENVMGEMFGELAGLYPEIKRACFDFSVKNYDRVKNDPSFQGA